MGVDVGSGEGRLAFGFKGEREGNGFGIWSGEGNGVDD